MPAETRTFTGVPSLGARQLSRVAVIGVGPRWLTSDAFRAHVHVIEPFNRGNQAGIIMPQHAGQVLAVTGSTSPVAVERLPVDDLAWRRPVGQDSCRAGSRRSIFADGAMLHNPVTGRKLGCNWPGSPESTSRCVASEQETRTLGERHIAAMDRPPSARKPAPEVQERYGIETVSAQIDDLFERVVAGSGRARGRVGHADG
jgi:hypothetical protein